MNDKYTTFKAQVGIDEIASYLGYKLDRRAGVGRYIEMCLRDGAGRKTDSIIISHPSDKSCQTYFHRNGSCGGDVISLVRENIDSFGVVGNTEQDKLNAVIDKFTGTSYAFNRYSMPHAMSSSRQPITLMPSCRTSDREASARKRSGYFSPTSYGSLTPRLNTSSATLPFLTDSLALTPLRALS